MGRGVRLSEGRFGRLVLEELAPGDAIRTGEEPAIVLQSRSDDVLFLNPAESHTIEAPTRVLVAYTAREWLRSSFPVFTEDEAHPFTQPIETITPRIRQLAD